MKSNTHLQTIASVLLMKLGRFHKVGSWIHKQRNDNKIIFKNKELLFVSNFSD